MELEEGQLLGGRYRLGARLGRSEIGECYAAVDQASSRECALKVLIPAVARAPAAWQAFQEVCRRVGGAGPDVFVLPSEFGLDQNLDRPFFASELIGDPSLLELVQQRGPVPLDTWARALRSVGNALASLPPASAAHGDLKPQNLFLSPSAEPRVRISDIGMIGLRRARPPAHGPGSLGFCPLEELDGRTRPSPAGDVYAVALMTFYALTGRHYSRGMWEPIPEASRVRQELDAPLTSASRHAEGLGAALASELDEWFALALAPDPTRRFTSVLAAASAFEAATGAPPSTSAGDPALSPTIPAPPPDRHAEPTFAEPAPTLDAATPAPGVSPTVVDASIARSRKPLSRRRLALAATTALVLVAGTVWAALRASSRARAAKALALPVSSASAATAAVSAAAPATPSGPAPHPSTPPAAPVTSVRFACRPVDCEFIVCDGRNIPKGVREAAIAPGKNRCSASRYGYRSATVEFEAREGDSPEVVFELTPVKAAAKPKAPKKKATVTSTQPKGTATVKSSTAKRAPSTTAGTRATKGAH